MNKIENKGFILKPEFYSQEEWCELYLQSIKNYQELKQKNNEKDNNWNELKEWLNYSIKKINEKLKNDNEEIIVKDGIIMNMNGYQILRLKTFRTKMKEVLDKIKELEENTGIEK